MQQYTALRGLLLICSTLPMFTLMTEEKFANSSQGVNIKVYKNIKGVKVRSKYSKYESFEMINVSINSIKL